MKIFFSDHKFQLHPLLIENCEIEAPGDDCLNVGTLMERIVDFSKESPKTITLCTTDNRYYYYTIRKGDQLQFLDPKTKREIGIATVEQVEFDSRRRRHKVVIDHEMPAFDPATVLVLNLNQMTSSTVIRNNVMMPYMRNAMLVRAQQMSIAGNTLDGTHGGVMGLNFTYSMGESARLRNITISKNLINGFQSSGIIVGSAYRDRSDMLDTRDFAITDNKFALGQGKAMRIRGVQNLSMNDNTVMKNGVHTKNATEFIEISDCVNVH